MGIAGHTDFLMTRGKKEEERELKVCLSPVRTRPQQPNILSLHISPTENFYHFPMVHIRGIKPLTNRSLGVSWDPNYRIAQSMSFRGCNKRTEVTRRNQGAERRQTQKESGSLQYITSWKSRVQGISRATITTTVAQLSDERERALPAACDNVKGTAEMD